MFFIDTDTCTDCNSCMDACPCDAIIRGDDGKLYIDPDLCIECGACYDVCEYNSVFEAELEEIPKKNV